MKEISLHILDIVQNSVNAGATIIRITIKVDNLEDKLTITVEDNGHGMDEETVKKVIDPFFTSRKTRKVGLGIPLLQAAAKRCGGDFIIESQPLKGTKVRAWFINSHIDRAPLGNIYDTMIGLIACNESIRFVYTHIFDGKDFVMDTGEITEKLGEVPITTPDVLDWIKCYLTEGINNLYGGVNNEINPRAGGNKEEDSSNNKC